MKTWGWTLVAVVAAYFAYRAWFASPDEDPAPVEIPAALEVPAVPPPAPEAPDPLRPRIDLSVPAKDASAGTGDEATRLAAEREEALRAGDAEAAARLAGRILETHPESDAARWIRYERGREYLRKAKEAGKTTEGLQHARAALLELTPVLFLREARSTDREALRVELRKLAHDVFFTRHVEGVDRIYEVKRGDALSRLCAKVFPQWGAQVSPGFVAAVNKLQSAGDLRAGEPIRVPLGAARIVIVKSEYRLYYLFAGSYVCDFPVGLGKEGTTPETVFQVDEMIKEPDWNPQPGVIIPFGDPRNILGTRWLGFRNTAEYRGFGIHGTSDPSSIGRDASSGCVRMLRQDVEQLFDWTPRGTQVEIRR